MPAEAGIAAQRAGLQSLIDEEESRLEARDSPATTCSPNHTGRSRRRPCDCCRACWRNCTRTSPTQQIRANWCAICVTFDTDAIHVSASDTIASDDTRLGLGSGLDRYRTIIETRGGTFQTRAGQAHWQLDVSIPIDGDR